MENRREEIAGLKRLLVGVIVSALFITMLPFENLGGIFAKAEEKLVPKEEAVIVNAQASTEQGSTERAEDKITAAFQTYEKSPEEYPNGMVINVYEDIYLDYVSVSGIVPENIYFVVPENVGAVKIYGFDYFTNSMEAVEKLNIYITGNAAIYAVGTNSDFDPETTVYEWGLRSGMQVTTGSTVNIDMIRFRIEQGASADLMGEGRTIRLPLDSSYNCAFYSTVEGWYVINEMEASVTEIGAAYIENGTFDVNAYAKEIGVSRVVYTQDAVNSLPEGVTLTYDNNLYVKTYQNPGTSFIVDNVNGMYHVSEDGKTMNVYAVRNGGHAMNDQTVAYFTDLEEVEATVALDIMGHFYATIGEGENQTEIACETVIFEPSAIPTSYVREVTQNDGMNEDKTFYLTEIFICETAYGFYGKNHFQFDASEHNGLKVYSEPDCVKATFSGGAEQNEIWVGIDNLMSGEENLKEVENETTQYRLQQTLFTQAGEPYIVKLKPGYTVSNIQFGGFVTTEEGYDYSNGYRAEASAIVPHPDGTIEFVMPTFGCVLGFTVEEIAEVESLEQVTATARLEEQGTYWYDADITITKTESEVCDITTSTEGTWQTSITENVEGEYQKQYYFVDKSLNEDGVSPSSTYGQISTFGMNYVLDKSAPTISAVVATDESGEELTLGEETTWTNSPSVTLTITADAGSGLPLAGYKFGTAEWQMEDSYTYTGEGLYDVEMQVKDEFDTKLESVNETRAEAETLYVTIGIDTTAPILLATGENSTTSAELKSNTQYEGNLYISCDDGTGSGLANINLYKKAGSEWTACNDLLVATEDASYIAPTSVDEIYKIEVVDKAGNETLYENVTILAAEQEVEEPETPAESETPEEPEAPTESETPEAPEVPTESETTEEPEAPTESETPEEPEAPTEPEEVVILGEGKVSLKKGTAYKLQEGTWNVTGDTTDYQGGIIFYVDEDGEYEFTRK